MDTPTAAVLHLEDSDLDADLIRDRLEKSGLPLAVERVSDRADFVSRLTGQRYDLILSDYQVPSFEGLEALDLAKQHQPGVPFIFVSGALGEEVAVETLKRGATDYILKQRLTRLAPAVERALAEARERKERRRAEERATAVLESMSEGFALFDADWRFAYVNAACERMNGVRREDLLGKNHWEVYPTTVGSSVETAYRRVVAEGVTVEFEHYHEPWGRWFAVKAYPAGGGGVCVQSREITAAKKADAELRVSEGRYRTLFTAMDEGYCVIEMIFDPADSERAVDYRFLEVNPAFEAQSGLRDATGRRMLEFVPNIEDHWLASYGRVARTGEPVRFANEYKTLRRWFDVYAFRVGSLHDGRIAVLFTDITARKRTEDALKESELRYRLVGQAANDAIWDWDLVTNRVTWNEGLQRVFGYAAEQVGRDASWWVDHIHPDDRERIAGGIHAAIDSGGEQWQDEYRYQRADGTYAEVLDRGRVVREAAGKATRMVGSMLDLTERKRAERMAKFVAGVSAALADLTDSVSTMQKVAGLTVPSFADWCAVDMLDEGGGRQRVAVMHADPARLRAYRELIEKYPPRTDDPHSVTHVLRTGQPDLLESIPDSLLEKTAHDEEHLRLLRGMGLKSHILVPIRSHGRTLGVLMLLTAESGRRYTPADLGVAQDIAQRAAVAIDNAALYLALQDADRKKDEFLATLAHELRNPLAPIRTGLQLMRMADGDARAAERARTMMERQTTQLVRLVDDLMDVSRISRGKIELKKERVELAAVVNSAVETSRPVIDQMDHALTVDLPDGQVWLDADPTRLAQVFMNLLNNSAKYTDRGGRIRLAAERQGGEVVVRVKDNGIGIPADKLASVFDLFSQVERSLEKAQGGLGIGLSLVRRLVELHDGTVEAHSDGPGKGSEFVVRLPAVAEKTVIRMADRNDGPAPKSALRILVVDDNRDGADSLADMLKIMGNDARTAYDGETGVAVAGEFRPDVVLLDIGMPKLNGHDACRRIRERQWGAGLVLIALTGWGQEEDRRRSHEAGFDHHMVKPVDPSQLMKLLAGLREVKR